MLLGLDTTKCEWDYLTLYYFILIEINTTLRFYSGVCLMSTGEEVEIMVVFFLGVPCGSAEGESERIGRIDLKS